MKETLERVPLEVRPRSLLNLGSALHHYWVSSTSGRKNRFE
jgi:hypothetical protein